MTSSFAIFLWSWVQTRPGAWNEKVLFFLFSFFSSQGKARQENPTVISSFQGMWGLRYLFFLFFSLAVARLYPPPKGVFRSFFSPSCNKKDLSAHVFPLWRCKQKLIDAFLCRLASLDKKIRLISLLFAIFDTKNALRSEKVDFHEKQQKVNFLILDPLCEKREKWFFSQFFLFPWFKGVLKHRLGRLHWDF